MAARRKTIVAVGWMRHARDARAMLKTPTSRGLMVSFFCLFRRRLLLTLLSSSSACMFVASRIAGSYRNRLYCIETAPYTPPTLPSTDGCHVMFVTRTRFTGVFTADTDVEKRLARIDGICNEEATTFGTPLVKSRTSVGYVAWLSATGAGSQVCEYSVRIVCCQQYYCRSMQNIECLNLYRLPVVWLDPTA
jgi:hypothetical protein